jgi:hypothetical protein
MGNFSDRRFSSSISEVLKILGTIQMVFGLKIFFQTSFKNKESVLGLNDLKQFEFECFSIGHNQKKKQNIKL